MPCYLLKHKSNPAIPYWNPLSGVPLHRVWNPAPFSDLQGLRDLATNHLPSPASSQTTLPCLLSSSLTDFLSLRRYFVPQACLCHTAWPAVLGPLCPASSCRHLSQLQRHIFRLRRRSFWQMPSFSSRLWLTKISVIYELLFSLAISLNKRKLSKCGDTPARFPVSSSRLCLAQCSAQTTCPGKFTKWSHEWVNGKDRAWLAHCSYLELWLLLSCSILWLCMWSFSSFKIEK